MKPPINTLLTRICLLTAGLVSSGAAASDWPSIRCRNASGVADGHATPATWNVETGDNIKWKTPIPGLAHSSPIVSGGRVFITGTPGRRDWYANLVANPGFTFHLKESARADLPARAAPVTDPEERRRVMSAPETGWYRGQASMEDLVARSPMVEVHFEQP